MKPAPDDDANCVRPAQPDDARAIAQVHWDSWQATYRGLLPDASFDAFPLRAREALWHSTALVAQLAPEKRQMLLVATAADAPDAAILGFACVGPLRTNGDVVAAPDRGELWALYLRPDVQRRGVGAALWQASTDWLRGAGFGEIALWVLAANSHAVAFYRRQGCERISTRDFDAGGGVPVGEECWRLVL